MRVRGALLCHTEQGDKLISEFGTAAEKTGAAVSSTVPHRGSGLLRCDQILRNEEERLQRAGTTEERTLCGTWYPGRECETGNSEGISSAPRTTLARLHTAAHLPVKMEYRRNPSWRSASATIWKFQKDPKVFADKKEEKMSSKNCCWQAPVRIWNREERAAAEMKASSYEKLRQRADEEGAVCHGKSASTIFCWKTAEAKRRSISTSGTSIFRWQILAILCGKFWKNMAGASARQNGS